MHPSIGSVGDAYDLSEMMNGLYKTELLKKKRRPWRSGDQVEYATAEWVDCYNANCTPASP